MNSPKKQKWTKERCLTSAMKYTSRSAWSKGDKKAYNAAQRYGWLEDCCVHMRNPKQKWTKERCLTSAMKYTSRSAWNKGDQKAYTAAQRHGWLDDCCQHMRNPNQKWTKERCLRAAKKFTTRSAWSEGDNNSYIAAIRNGWFEECCAHMQSPQNGWRRKWTKERCLKSAMKYTSRSNWAEGDSRAYGAAYRHGWLEDCCAHMQRKRLIFKSPRQLRFR